MVRLLVHNGARLDVRNKENMTPVTFFLGGEINEQIFFYLY